MLFKKLIDFIDRITSMLTFKMGSTQRPSETLQRGRGGQEQEACLHVLEFLRAEITLTCLTRDTTQNLHCPTFCGESAPLGVAHRARGVDDKGII